MGKHATSFDVTDPAVFFRMMLGALYVPHILFKLMDINGAEAFFGKPASSPRCSSSC